jgi:phosphoribosylanthranilate isomerase
MTAPARTPRPGPPAGARVAVKICGVTDPASALLSAELGADYLGLNFWPGSPRCLDLPRAREIAAAVRAAAPRVVLVGVFVHPAAAAVREAAEAVGLDLLQFSGDETPEDVRPFAGCAIKALRLEQESQAAAVAAFADCWGLLLDAPAGAGASGARGAAAGGRAPAASPMAGAGAAPLYGGTGRQWDYAAAAAVISGAGPGPAGSADAAASPGLAAARRRIFLAGGLRPANVRRVVAALRPFAVDVCSGVESAPGRKDPRLLRQLFEEVRNGQAPVAT